jgi:hypothetical protein
MANWLCKGDKKIPKCICSEIEIKDYWSMWEKRKRLVIYCNAKHKYIHKFVTSCSNYNNQTLFGEVKNE